VVFAYLADSTAAIGTRELASPANLLIDFFRGPNGDFIRHVRYSCGTLPPRIRLSHDGGLVAICAHHQVEIQAVADPQRLFLTPTGSGRQPSRLWVGDSGIVISCGRMGYSWHLVEWNGDLTVQTENRRAATLVAGFKNPEFERFVSTGPKPVTSIQVVVPADPGGNLNYGTIGSMHPALDRNGQVSMFDARANLVLHFYARGDSWSAWMPDGARLGRGNVHLWRNTPGAAAKMGAVLRRAMKGGGA
jgi:hypothetical protein